MKRSLLLAVALLGCFTLSAQTVENKDAKHKVETNLYGDNWFISAGIGGQVFAGENYGTADLVDVINPAIDLNVGKWITPGVGVRFGYYGVSATTVTEMQDMYWVTGAYDANNYEREFDLGVFHADVMMDLLNMIKGYRVDRLYSVVPYFGVGLMQVWDAPSETQLCATTGVINTFRINDKWDFNVELRSAITNDRFDGLEGGKGFDMLFGATIGVTYQFPTRGWGKAEPEVVGVTRAEMQDVRDKLKDSRAKSGDLKDRLAYLQRNPNIEERIIKEKSIVPTIFVFAFNSSKMTRLMRANVGHLAEEIKSGDPNKTYVVTGYADKETGDANWNMKLSEKRANAVFKCLVEEFGIESSRLKVAFKGGTDNMFYDNRRLNRSVIVE